MIKLDCSTVEAHDCDIKLALAIHKQDGISIINDTFQRFFQVLATKHGDSETYRNFETRFDASVCRLNASCPGSELPSAILSFQCLQVLILLFAVIPYYLVSTTKISFRYFVRRTNHVLKSLLQPYNPILLLPLNTDPNPEGSSLFQNLQISKSNPPPIGAVGKVTEHLTETSKCVGNQKRYTNSDGNSVTQGASPPVHKNTLNKAGRVTFQMGQILSGYSGSELSNTAPGPLLDDGAPYSGLGEVALCSLRSTIMTEWNGRVDPIPDTIAATLFWQYGSGSYGSPRRAITGSVLIPANTMNGNMILVHHLILEGSSQWAVGRSVTRKANIIHRGDNVLEFEIPHHEGNVIDTMPLVDVGDHSYLRFDNFVQNATPIPPQAVAALICGFIGTTVTLIWPELKRIVDKVHRHVCRHSNYNDIKLVLQRNNILTDTCASYLTKLLQGCSHCHVIDVPTGSRVVSLANVSRSFNEVVCVDHFFPENLVVFNVMDARNRYFVGCIVSSTNMSEAVAAFESLWVSQFWPPGSLQDDQFFDTKEFNICSNII